MAGLQSLMPGQAVPPQMTAPKSAATPAAEVRQYEGMSLEELVAAYMRKPSGVLLGLIDKAEKARKLNEEQQGQAAIAQARQQQGTVADEKLAQVLQGAGGMRRMATGGIVALAEGGSSTAEPTYENPDFDEEGRPRGATEKAEIIRRNRLRQQAFERTRQGAPRSLTDIKPMIPLMPLEAIRRLQEFPPLGRGMAAETAAQSSTPGPRNRPQGEGVAPAAEPVPTPSPRQRTRENDGKAQQEPPAAAPAVDSIAQAFRALLATQPPQGISPELQAQREKVTGLQALQEQQALEDAKRIREEVVRTGQRRMDRANTPFIEDAQALAALAGAIDPRKGYTFGSLGTGIASALSEREARKQKAEEYIATGSDKVRQLNATYRQLQLENAKYEEARRSGDAKAVRESAENIAALRYKYETDRAELEIKRSEARAKTIAAEAQAAAVPGRQALAEASLLQKRMQSPEGVQYSQLADAKAKLLANPLADAKAVAALDAEMARLQRLMDVKYGGIGMLAPTATTPATDTNDVEARAAEIMKGQ